MSTCVPEFLWFRTDKTTITCFSNGNLWFFITFFSPQTDLAWLFQMRTFFIASMKYCGITPETWQDSRDFFFKSIVLVVLQKSNFKYSVVLHIYLSSESQVFVRCWSFHCFERRFHSSVQSKRLLFYVMRYTNSTWNWKVKSPVAVALHLPTSTVSLEGCIHMPTRQLHPPRRRT